MNSRKINPLIPSGIYNLDYFICGGYPINGLTLIEEDEFACFSNLLLNCTISNHLHDSKKVHLSLPTKTDVDGFLKELPQRTKSNQSDQTDEQSMKIAWRYSNLPDLDEMPNQNRNDFQFELKKKVDDELIKEKQMNENLTICSHDELFDQLRSSIDDKAQLVIIRNYASIHRTFDDKQFCTFLFKLKSLSRSNNLCFVLSVNSNYLSASTRQLSINIADCSFKIDRITENSAYKDDYLGLIKINKLPKINCLNYQTNTETLEIGIQLRKSKYLNVDKLFLPPELSDAPSRACASTKIDF